MDFYDIKYTTILTIMLPILLAIAFYIKKVKKAEKSFNRAFVIITGSSSGIGEQLAYQYAYKKCQLLLIALERDLLEQVRSNCIQKGATSVKLLYGDLTDENFINTVGKKISALSRIDVLHLNHGVLENRFFFDYENSRNWQHFLKVNNCNFLSHIRIFFYAINALVSNPNGSSVGVTCSAGVAGPLPFDGAYIAAKTALASYFENVRQELKLLNLSVGVTVLFPGAIDTAFTRKHPGINSRSSSPEKLARRFLESMCRGEKHLIFPGVVRAAFWIHQLCPRFYNFIVSKLVYLPNRPDCLGRLNEMRETLGKQFAN